MRGIRSRPLLRGSFMYPRVVALDLVLVLGQLHKAKGEESDTTVQLKGKNKCRSQLENGQANKDQMESVQEKMKELHVSHSNSVSSDKRPAYNTGS